MIGTNAGHGHAWERPDGAKARCGGPGVCSECAGDAQAVVNAGKVGAERPAFESGERARQERFKEERAACLCGLPMYRSHKVVRAAAITKVLPADLQGNREVLVEWGGGAWGTARLVTCEPAMFARFKPEAGDFIVVYDDDYVAFSPRRAFTEGYTRIPGAGSRGADGFGSFEERG